MTPNFRVAPEPTEHLGPSHVEGCQHRSGEKRDIDMFGLHILMVKLRLAIENGKTSSLLVVEARGFYYSSGSSSFIYWKMGLRDVQGYGIGPKSKAHFGPQRDGKFFIHIPINGNKTKFLGHRERLQCLSPQS